MAMREDIPGNERLVGDRKSAKAALAHFSALCTQQNSSHWALTLFFPRKVKRPSPLLCLRFPNTGSTMCIRLP